jgi:cell division protein FtsL
MSANAVGLVLVVAFFLVVVALLSWIVAQEMAAKDAEIAELRSEIATLNAVMREMPSERDLEAAYRAGVQSEDTP